MTNFVFEMEVPDLRPVKIFADSTCDLSPELVEKYDITITPLYVSLGDKAYIDGVEIHPKDIFKYYNETKKLPKTAAVPVTYYEEVFKAAVSEGYDVIHFAISAEFSACYQNACIAAKEIGNVWTIDSRNLSTGIGHLVLIAAELAASGKTAEEIAEYVKEVAERLDVSFIIDKLEFLYKGGRCSGVAALGANVLKLKPCIEVVDGKMIVGKKYRGSFEKVVKEYIKERLEGNDSIDLKRIFLTWTGVDSKLINELTEEIKSYLPFEEVLVTEAGSTVTGHCGPGTLGILYIHKKNK